MTFHLAVFQVNDGRFHDRLGVLAAGVDRQGAADMDMPG